MSDRRAARQRQASTTTTDSIPADLAAGPCIEIWAKKGEMPTWSARKHWKAARAAWAKANGINLPGDYRHLPRELRDRAPYYRTPTTEEHI